MLKFIVFVVLLIIVVRSKFFKLWWMGRNKTENQKKAIKYLLFGPKRSKISTEDYDFICNDMYPDHVIFKKALSKLGITESDVVKHPYDKIDARYLCVRNYLKTGEKVLIYDLSINDFRTSRMDSFMVIFGSEKLYFYQLSYRTDKLEEEEHCFAYPYDEIKYFKVEEISRQNDNLIYTSFRLIKEISTNAVKEFPSLVLSKNNFDKWVAVGTHLDSPDLKKECKEKDETERKTLRYFRAYYNLPLVISDNEYEDLIISKLPADQLKEQGMDVIGIQDHQINLAAPIAFRSYVYGDDVLEIKGRDGTWRSSEPQLTWLLFGKQQVYVYMFSMRLDNSIQREVSQEIFYSKFASIRTEQKRKERVIDDVKYIMSYYKFTIFFSGDSLSLTLPILGNENETKIKGMRNLIREVQGKMINGGGSKDEDIA